MTYANGRKYNRALSTIGVDKGAHEEIPKPCAQRTGNGGWCELSDRHSGPCYGAPRQHGPVESIWHQHKGQMKICGKVTGPATLCEMQRGHHGACK